MGKGLLRKRAAALAAASVVAILFSPLGTRVARADLASVYFKAQTGGGSGFGIFGDQKENSKYQNVGGLAYGFVVGAELLFVDIWVDHNQFVGNGGFRGTWTKFMLGFDTEVGFGERRDASVDDDGYFTGGYYANYFEIGGGVGLGAGTLEQVNPPLNSEQLDDKGFVAQIHGGAGYRFNRYVSLGAVVPIEFGYLFKQGAANNSANQYGAIGYSLLVQLRFQLTQ